MNVVPIVEFLSLFTWLRMLRIDRCNRRLFCCHQRPRPRHATKTPALAVTTGGWLDFQFLAGCLSGYAALRFRLIRTMRKTGGEGSPLFTQPAATRQYPDESESSNGVTMVTGAAPPLPLPLPSDESCKGSPSALAHDVAENSRRFDVLEWVSGVNGFLPLNRPPKVKTTTKQ